MNMAGQAVSDACQRQRVLERLHACLLLGKPGILLLTAVTGLAAMVREGSLLAEPLRFTGVLLGILLAGAAANGLNHFWDRDIDAVMARTRERRPLPAGRITPAGALLFSLLAGAAAVWLLLAAGSGLAALLALGAIVFYFLVYTVWLKRRTPLNIVIGGAAGAAPPLIGWAAGGGELGLVPLLMFLVIFLWTPPHFWALALCLKEDYARAGVPMLPVVAGEERTRRQMAVYAALLLPATIWLGLSAGCGGLYFIGAALLGLLLIQRLVRLHLRQDYQSARGLFGFSIFYLAALFSLLMVSGG